MTFILYISPIIVLRLLSSVLLPYLRLCAGSQVRLCGSRTGAGKSCSSYNKALLNFLSIRLALKAAQEQPSSYSSKPSSAFASSQKGEANKPQEPPTDSLRCVICYGRRSPSYHRKHAKDPIEFPAAGVCSRRRTNCKLVRVRWSASAMEVLAIPELPADLDVQKGNLASTSFAVL